MALTKVTGSVIKDSVSLSGNVSVGGTLTYQDVTNVDALGIGTFRTGINVSGGQVDVGSNIKLGNAGVITATSFSGVMSGTTGSFSGQVNVGSNIKLGTAGVITATTFHGSGANLTGIDSTQIVTGNTSVQTVDTGSDGHIKVTTEGTERARIDSSGRMGLGTNSPTSYDNEAKNLVVASADHTGITIASTGSSKRNNIYFADGTSGNEKYRGAITYDLSLIHI